MARGRRRRPRPPVEALGGGRYTVNIDDAEVAVVLDLLAQLRDLLTAADVDDPRLRRLFPAAYHDDPERDAEYQRLMREDLVASKLSAIEQVTSVLHDPETRQDIDDEQLTALLQGVNALRLVLGTLLDVGEEEDPTLIADDDPLAPEHHLYAWLSWLLDWTVRALTSSLPASEDRGR